MLTKLLTGRFVSLALLATCIALWSCPSPVSALAVRGKTRWAVLLCRFSDKTAVTPQQPQFFREFFTEAGAGKKGLFDYWRDTSNGAIDLTGSVVMGWYNMAVTLAQSAAKSRWDRIQDCVTTAKANGFDPAGFYVAAMLNAAVDSGSAGGQVLLDPGAWFNSFAAHETGHGYGLSHSFSDDTTCQNAVWSAPGEYCDPYDVMSVQAAFMFNAGTYGSSGPGLIAPYLERQGWIPINRVYTTGSDGATSGTFTLAALSRPAAAGYLALRVPFDAANGFVYYTVELRIPDRWDAALPRATVLIHEVRDNNIAYLVTKPQAEWLPGSTFSRAQSWTTFSVSVNSINVAAGTASVTVRSDFAARCLPGWVWRGVTPNDLACVTGAVRDQTASDNRLAASRRNPAGGPYGPDTCLQGYVWRDAVANDHVCVLPATRTQAASDNADQARRINPARFVYGALTCKAGFVWRETDPLDYVCVEGWVRDRVRADNAAATTRWVNGAYGPKTCIAGYVWREAFPTDVVCTTPDFRQRCKTDNSNYSANSLAKP